MADSVGAISLDLVIKNKIGEQLDKLRSSVSSSAMKLGESIEAAVEKPMKKISETAVKTVSDAINKIEDSFNKGFDIDIEKPMKKISETAVDTVNKAMDNINESFDYGISDAIKRDEERRKKQLEDMMNAVNEPLSAPSPINPKSIGYDLDAVKYIDEYEKKCSKTAEKINSKISETVENAKEKLSSFKISSDPIKRIHQEINIYNTKMDLLQKKWQELSSAEPTDKIKSQIKSTESQMISMQNAIDKLESKLKGLQELTAFEKLSLGAKKAGKEIVSFLTAPLRGIKNTITEPFMAALNAIKSGYFKLKNYLEHPLLAVRDLGKKTFSVLKSTGGKAFNSLKSTVGAVGGKLKELGKNAVSVTKPVSKLGNTLKKAFKSVFLMAGVYAAFRAIKDGLLEAAKADEKFSKSLNDVKANLSIAFTPIVQAIMPALNSLMAGLASLTRNVAGFIAGLFGTTYKQAAEATKKLKGVTDTAKKAKMATAGIDEMNILSSGDSSSDDKDSGGIDYSNIDMSEPKLPDWAERLKVAIKSGDWAGVSAILAERVNNAFGSIKWEPLSEKVNSGVRKITDGINGFLDNINWGTLGDTFAGGLNTITGAVNTFFEGVKWDKLGSGIATGLNRAIKKIKWKQLGKSLSANIQALIDTLYSFVTTFDWSGFGKSIGESVNGWFEGIDFGKAGKTFSEGVKGLFDTAINFVQTVDWRQIGEKVAEFISNIDYAGIAKRFFELLGSAIGAAVSLIWGAISGAVDSIRDYFSKKIEECGGSVIGGLWKGIKDALKNAGKWIKDNIFKPFIDGFKKAFGIASPSKEMGILGGYIVDGLYNAVADGIARIKEIFEKMLKTIKDVFKLIDTWFKEKFDNARDNIENAFSTIGEWFSDRWKDITTVFSVVGTWFKERFEAAWSNIKDAFSSVGTWFSDRWDDITKVFSGVGKWFKDRFQAAYDNVTGIWEKVTGFFSGIWEGISDGARDGVNWVIGHLNSMLDRVEDTINFIVDGINSINFGEINLPNIVKKKLGLDDFSINIPRVSIGDIPYLASGGLATAPTLAMVGDNRNARTDPEVIAPLSKLEGMLGGGNTEIIELLKIIVELLRAGMNIEVVNYLFRNQSEFSRLIAKVTRDNSVRGGG